MDKKNDYIYDAVFALEQLSGLPISMESQRKESNAIIKINGYRFVVVAKNEVRKENKEMLISQITQTITSPFLLITNYITNDSAEDLRKREINYLDSAGNCFIKNDLLFIAVFGQKVHRNKQKTNQTKAFQEAGIRLLFHLLSNPENIQLSYRELAELAGISIGSVSNIISELENQHYILKTKKKRILKNKPELLERWIIAYHDVLRPRLFKKQMHFIKQPLLNDIELRDNVLWGGEPGAAILTNHLIPEQFTIYTNQNWQKLKSSIGLIPDENGKVEVLQQFWKQEDNKTTIPPLLIYVDLIGSGYGRNVETAKIILENELPHIFGNSAIRNRI